MVSIGTPNQAVVLDPAAPLPSARRCARRRCLPHTSSSTPRLMTKPGCWSSVTRVGKIYDTLVTARLASPDERPARPGCRSRPAPHRRLRAAQDHCSRRRGGQTGRLEGPDVQGAGAQLAALRRLRRARHQHDGAAVRGPAVRWPPLLGDHPFRTTATSSRRRPRADGQPRPPGLQLPRSSSTSGRSTSCATRWAGSSPPTTPSCSLGRRRERHAADQDEAMRALDEHGALPSEWPRARRTTSRQPTSATSTSSRPSTRGGADGALDGPALRRRLRRVGHHARSPRAASIRTSRCARTRTGRMSYGSPALQQFLRRCAPDDRLEHPVGPRTGSRSSRSSPAYVPAGERGIVDHYEAGGDVYEPAAAAGVDRDTGLADRPRLRHVRPGRRPQGARPHSPRSTWSKIFGYLSNMRTAMRRRSATSAISTAASRRCPAALPLDPGPEDRQPPVLRGGRGINYYVQGSSYDLLSEAIADIDRHGLADAVQIAMHDELAVDTDAAADVAIMATLFAFVELAGCTPVPCADRADLVAPVLKKERHAPVSLGSARCSTSRSARSPSTPPAWATPSSPRPGTKGRLHANAQGGEARQPGHPWCATRLPTRKAADPLQRLRQEHLISTSASSPGPAVWSPSTSTLTPR